MRSKAPGDLEQEVADLRSETLALRKANNELAQAARLQKVRQQKLVDELKHATRLPEHRTAASRTRERELDEFVAALRDENAKLRRRNLKLHDSVRLAADRPVKSKRQTPRPRKENRVANRVRDMLDQIGERVARAESKVDDVAPRPLVERHNKDILELQERLKDSHTKVQILEHQIGQIEAAMQAGKQVQKHAVEQVDKYKALLEDMQGKYRAAQAKVKQLEVTSEQTAALNLMIEDLQATNANLQAQVDGLTRSAFMSDEAESRRLRSVEADHLAQISELRLVVAERDHALESSTAKINDQMARLQQLEAEALQSAQAREQLQRELAAIRERMRHLDDRVHVFTADSGVELEELDLALDLIRRQKGLFRAAGPDADPVTIPALQRKVRELEILNKDLVTELKCKEDMLRIQTHLNSELDAEYTRVQAENRDLKQSIFEMQRSVAARPRAESVISDMSLLSQLSTLSFTENHNVIVVRVTGARFTSLKDGTDALTFIGIDFFDFETVYSGVFAGAQPHYKLTAQFKVAVDAFLLDHLRSKSIRVDVYRQTDQGDVQRFAVCCIPLAGLLGHTQRIRDSYEAVDVDKTGKPVGTIDVVAKMYRPVVSTLPTPADSDNGTPREDGKPATFTMRMTLGVQSLVVNGVDHADGLTLHAHNMYYNVDGVAERVTGKDRPTFAIEFETKHDRLLPHELVRFEVLKGGPDGTLVGHFDLVLTRIAQAQYGEITSTLPVKDDNDGEIGSCDLSVEWILAANPLT